MHEMHRLHQDPKAYIAMLDDPKRDEYQGSVIPDNTTPEFERCPRFDVSGRVAALMRSQFVQFQDQHETAWGAMESFENQHAQPGILNDNSPSLN
jgi:hypothetical protein